MPILIEIVPALSDRCGPVHAGSFIRERRIALDSGLLGEPRELARILVHELFHFAWVRLGNARRRSFEELLAREIGRQARGELGWSAEWRKGGLRPGDAARRTPRWREYVCESFCDTAAWLFANIDSHPEFTLAARHRRARREWFEAAGLDRVVRV